MTLRHILLFLTVFVLMAWLPTGCGESQADKEFKQFRENLTNLHQMKLGQLEQLNEELVSLKAKIDEKEQELKHLENLTSGIKAVSRMTTEEIAASFTINGVRTRLAELKEEEQVLLGRKQALENEIREVEILLSKR